MDCQMELLTGYFPGLCEGAALGDAVEGAEDELHVFCPAVPFKGGGLG